MFANFTVLYSRRGGMAVLRTAGLADPAAASSPVTARPARTLSGTHRRPIRDRPSHHIR